MRRRAAIVVVAALMTLSLVRCGGGGADRGAADADALVQPDGADVGGGAPEIDEDVVTCPAGQTAGLAGRCQPVGVPVCAPRFVGPDGLCRPRFAACAPGTIPKLDEGCVPVGIRGCAALFRGEDGICRPSMAACADQPGTIPRFDVGCVPVGIPGCAAAFVDDDGLCRPSLAKCADEPGTIPSFAEGCVPVGPEHCAPEFVGEDGLCHPTAADCAEGTTAVPSTGCFDLDGPAGCGEAPWGAIEDGPDTFYVDASAPDDSGDGRRGSPAKTIAAVIDQVPAGGRLVLAAGTYAEPLVLTRSIRVEGRCASLVTVSGTVRTGFEDRVAIVFVDGAADVTLRGLRLSGDGMGLIVRDAPALTLERLRVEGTQGIGVRISGATTTGAIVDSLVRDTRAIADTGLFGTGVQVSDGAQVTLTRTALLANRTFGLASFDPGTLVTVEDALIEGTLPQDADGASGVGVHVAIGGSVAATNLAVVRNHMVGVGVVDAGSRVELRRSVVEETASEAPTRAWGVGLIVGQRAQLDVSGTVVRSNRTVGVLSRDLGTVLTLTGSLVRDTLPQENNNGFGMGVEVAAGVTATLTGNAIIGNRAVGVLTEGSGADLTAASNLVEGTLPYEPDQGWGIGLQVSLQARGTLRGNAVIGNRTAGINVNGAYTSAAVEDNLVEGTLPRAADGELGEGVEVSMGALATLSRNAILGNRSVAVVANGPHSELRMEANLVAGTLPQESDGSSGRGVQVDQGAFAQLARDVIFDNRDTGIWAGGAAAGLVVDQTLVEGTQLGEDGEWGIGLKAAGIARLELRGLAVLGSRRTGVSIGNTRDFRFENSLVEGTRARPGAPDGVGVVLAASATGTLSGSVVRGNRTAGVFVQDAGTSVTLAGNLLAENLPQETDQILGCGAYVGFAAEAILSDNALIGNMFYGFGVVGTDTTVTATGNLIEGTVVAPGQATTGEAFAVHSGGRAQLTGNVLLGNRGAGFVRGATLILTENLLDGELGEGLIAGRGLWLQDGAEAILRRNAIGGTSLFALTVVGAGTEVGSEGDLIEGSRPIEGDLMGAGVVVGRDAHLSLTGGVIRSNLVVGLMALERARVEVSGVLVDRTLRGRSSEDMVDLADGLVAAVSATLHVADSEIVGCARAALIFEDAGGGSVVRTRCRGNGHGLVAPEGVVGAEVDCPIEPGLELGIAALPTDAPALPPDIAPQVLQD
jgi:hypothetical protein